MRVDVYRNLRTGTWSVRHRGKVIGTYEYVYVQDAQFVVQPAGNARVRSEKRKNVHAFVRGELKVRGEYIECDSALGQRITYNPYEDTTFVLDACGTPVHSAALVECLPAGVFAEWPETVLATGG